jgi:ADP-heptose:LPS heptosyltransferase
MKTNEVVIVNFGAFGDIINSTPLAKHYSLEGNKIYFVTRKRYSDVLKENEFIDKIYCFQEKVNMNNVSMTINSKRKIEKLFSGKKIIYSAPYMSPKYDGTPRSNLLSIIKEECSQVQEWLCDFVPVIRLTEEQEYEARNFFSCIPKRKTILIEYEYFSAQSFLNFSHIEKSLDNIKEQVNIIFTGKNFPKEMAKLQQKFSGHNFYHYSGSFKSNAALYNMCDLFVGCSSGITCLTSSDYCLETETKRIECCRG